MWDEARQCWSPDQDLCLKSGTLHVQKLYDAICPCTFAPFISASATFCSLVRFPVHVVRLDAVHLLVISLVDVQDALKRTREIVGSWDEPRFAPKEEMEGLGLDEAEAEPSFGLDEAGEGFDLDEREPTRGLDEANDASSPKREPSPEHELESDGAEPYSGNDAPEPLRSGLTEPEPELTADPNQTEQGSAQNGLSLERREADRVGDEEQSDAGSEFTWSNANAVDKNKAKTKEMEHTTEAPRATKRGRDPAGGESESGADDASSKGSKAHTEGDLSKVGWNEDFTAVKGETTAHAPKTDKKTQSDAIEAEGGQNALGNLHMKEAASPVSSLTDAQGERGDEGESEDDDDDDFAKDWPAIDAKPGDSAEETESHQGAVEQNADAVDFDAPSESKGATDSKAAIDAGGVTWHVGGDHTSKAKTSKDGTGVRKDFEDG